MKQRFCARMCPALAVLFLSAASGCGSGGSAAAGEHDATADATGDQAADRPAAPDAPVAPEVPPDAPADAALPDADALPAGCSDPFYTDRVVPVSLELSADAWQAIKADPQAEEFQEGAFVFDGERVEQVGIRVKGNSSLSFIVQKGSDRFSFKVDFNEYVKGQEFCGLKKLVFNNGFKDPTLIREHLAYRLAREMGLPASRTAFVDLTVAGKHMGLYTMVEPVDDNFFLDARFPDNNGDMYKPEPPAGWLQYMGDKFDQYPGLDVERNEDTTDHAAFLTLVDVLNHGAPNEYGNVMDVEEVLRYHALDALLVNLDSYCGYGHNYYLYEQQDIFTVIPWDLNEAFGNFTCNCSRDALIHFRIDEPTCGPPAERPLIAKLLAVPEHKAKYHAILKELADGLFAESAMNAWIDEAADLIRPFVQADTTKFYPTETFEKALVEDVSSRGAPSLDIVIGLKAFVAERRAAILAQLGGSEPAVSAGKGSCVSGPNPVLCPDGICDEAEQKDPDLCPADCLGQ